MSSNTVTGGPRGSYSINEHHMPLWPFVLGLSYYGGIVAALFGAFGNGHETLTWCIFAAVFPIALLALGMVLEATTHRH